MTDQYDYKASEMKRMQAGFETGNLSRRDFMQGLLAMGLSVSSAGVLIAGSHDVVAATPKRGGRLRWAYNLHGPNDTLDPQLMNSPTDYLRVRAYYGSLVRFNDDLTVSPELAEEWTANKAVTEWTFKLRKGVTFHDGATLDADDVIYTLNRHTMEGSKSKAKPLVAMVTEWKKVDQYTFKAIMSSPNADLPSVLGTFHFKIIQKGADETDGYFQKPNGSGPFKVKEFSPGVRSVGVRFDNYFMDGRPYLDELETFAITDTAARMNAVISGDIHIAGAADPKSFQQIKDAPNVDLFTVKASGYTDIVCMLDRAPGNNPDFVKGMKYLQNRERMIKLVMKESGAVANDHPIGPAYPDHCKELEQTPFDLDKARFHIKKSGITEVEIEVGEVRPGITDICLMVQRDAAKVGLTFNVKRVPTDGYWGAIWMKKPLHTSGWNMRPTANIMMTLNCAGGAPWNESRYVSERFDSLLLQSRGELDPGKKAEMYCEMQKLIRDEAGVIIPVFLNYIDAVAKNVRGLTHVPLTYTGGCEWPDQVWLDS